MHAAACQTRAAHNKGIEDALSGAAQSNRTQDHQYRQSWRRTLQCPILNVHPTAHASEGARVQAMWRRHSLSYSEILHRHQRLDCICIITAAGLVLSVTFAMPARLQSQQSSPSHEHRIATCHCCGAAGATCIANPTGPSKLNAHATNPQRIS